MTAHRVLLVLVCWTAVLLATCLPVPRMPKVPPVELLGHLQSKGNVIGAVYTISADIVVAYSRTPTDGSWQSATCISGPCETAITLHLQRINSFSNIGEHNITAITDNSGLGIHDLVRKEFIVKLPIDNDTCERQLGSLTLHTGGPKTNLTELVLSNSTIESLASFICSRLSPTLPSCSNDYDTTFSCTKLANGYGVCWTQQRKFGHFILCGNDIGPGKYMAFGWSRNVKKTIMDKTDAVVCSHHINGTWDVEDYYLESRQPCGIDQGGETVGVCPDIAFGGASNILSTSGKYENGVGYCRFRRWPYTSRPHDMKITVKKQQAIVWAIGPIGEDGQIQKHSERAGDLEFFNFSGGDQQCELGDPYCCCYNIIQE